MRRLCSVCDSETVHTCKLQTCRRAPDREAQGQLPPTPLINQALVLGGGGLEGGQREVCVLFAMPYFVLVLENRKLCLGRMRGSVPGVGCESIVLCCLGWTCC